MKRKTQFDFRWFLVLASFFALSACDGTEDDSADASADTPADQAISDPGDEKKDKGGEDLSCEAEEVVCGDECVDTDTSAEHCGACDSACGDNFACGDGECICEAPYILCGDKCIDPDTDMMFCGASADCAGENVGEACDPDYAACNDGTCVFDGCADDVVAEELFENGMVGCAGTVTYPDAETLCAEGYEMCSAQDWLANYDEQAPAYNYWTSSALRYTGPSSSCSVSTETGTDCGANTPMRVCAGDPDGLGNDCNWTSCGYESTENQYFGGCSGNTTAGTLCCKKPEIVILPPPLVL